MTATPLGGQVPPFCGPNAPVPASPCAPVPAGGRAIVPQSGHLGNAGGTLTCANADIH
jgi:hypothetical protein